MEIIKHLLSSTRFGILALFLYFVGGIAEKNPDIAAICVYAMTCATVAHVISRTIRPGNGNGKTQDEITTPDNPVA